MHHKVDFEIVTEKDPNKLFTLTEAEALVTLVGFAREDVEEGRVLSSEGFKDKLRKRKEALNQSK